MTTNIEAQNKLNRIRQLKNELAQLMFECFMFLKPYDQHYVDLMMDDPEIDDQ